MSNEHKYCPVCGEAILSVEKICGHCGSAIDDHIDQSGDAKNMRKMFMNDSDKRAFRMALNFSKGWCSKHQVLVGVGEMALGAALITWGLHTGSVQLGADVVSDGGLLGGATGLGLGAVAGNIIGAIGIVPLGGIAIPAIAMIAGGAAIFGAFGYTVGDIAARFSAHVGGFGDLLLGASALSVGLALLLDGARRIAKNATVRKVASMLKDGVIYLVRKAAEGTARTWKGVQKQLKQLGISDAITGSASVAGGMAVGAGIAASTVTVLGSHGLGALALSVGLVSAPIWPVFAGGAAALVAWKAVRSVSDR